MFGNRFQLNDKSFSIVQEIGSHMPGGFFIYKEEEPGELLYANGAVLRIFGCADLEEFKELTHNSFKGMVHEKDLERIVNDVLPVHVVEKKIPYMDKDGNEVKPEEPNGYKFEQLAVDLVRELDTCLPYEVLREKEFAPIKNKTGIDSVESARELCKANGIEL